MTLDGVTEIPQTTKGSRILAVRIRIWKKTNLTSSPAIPLWVGTMCTRESWDINRQTSFIFLVSQCELVSGSGLRKLRSVPHCGLQKDFVFYMLVCLNIAESLVHLVSLTGWIIISMCVVLSFVL